MNFDLDFDNFELALSELEPSLSQAAFDHLLNIIDTENRRRRKTELSPCPSSQAIGKSGSSISRFSIGGLLNQSSRSRTRATATTSQNRRHLPKTLSRLQLAVEADSGSESVQENILGTRPTPSDRTRGHARVESRRSRRSDCSRSLVCRKIISKVQDKKQCHASRLAHTVTKSRASEPESVRTRTRCSNSSYNSSRLSKYVGISRTSQSPDLDLEQSTIEGAEAEVHAASRPVVTPLEPITGKIVHATTATRPSQSNRTRSTSDRRRTQTCTPPAAVPVRDFTRTVSNPLYRNYSPRGYVKSDDELILEKVEGLVDRFKSWVLGVGGGMPAAGFLESEQDDRILEAVNTSDLYSIIRAGMEKP